MSELPTVSLQVRPAQGDPFHHLLEDKEVVVGRAAGCDLQIRDRFLSRQHARIFLKKGVWRIQDLGSRNGTRVNGRPIGDLSKELQLGDSIQLSASELVVTDAASHSTPPPGLVSKGGDRTLYVRAAELLARERSVVQSDDRSVEDLYRYNQRLELLHDVHRLLAETAELDELLRLILAKSFDELQPEEGAIFLRQEDGSFDQVAHRAIPELGDQHLLSETLQEEVGDKGLAALVLDVQADERFQAAESLISTGVRSLVAAPLIDDQGSLGLIALNSRLHRREFTEDDLGLLVSLASVAALRIRNARLAAEAAERHRLAEEVKLARSIQVSLLPDSVPQPHGYTIAGSAAPSQGASGDIYLAVERNEGHECVLVVADVSGKGIAAALLTASLEALLAGPIETGQGPEEILELVNRRLYVRTPAERYATCFVAVLDVWTGAYRYANAGHNPALLLRAGGEIETLPSSGVPVGLLPESRYIGYEIELEPGDSVLAYTDGITEANDPQEEEYGLDRLQAVCGQHLDADPEELFAAVHADLDKFAAGTPYADDRTMLALRRNVK